MDIFDLKRIKKASKLTNKEIAELSGIPVSTVNKIFSGATENPRYATLLAIEEVLTKKEQLPFTYDEHRQEPVFIREEATEYEYTARKYGEEDIERLTEGTRVELINGKLYMLAAPTRKHQFLVTELLFKIRGFIQERQGGCHVYASPFDVRLFGDDETVVQPDVSVVCKRDILTEQGCCGAPDWVIEIVSKSSSPHDYIRKLVQYQKAGVREYWIVDSYQRMVTVYNFERHQQTGQYAFEDRIPSGILAGLEICIAELMENF